MNLNAQFEEVALSLAKNDVDNMLKSVYTWSILANESITKYKRMCQLTNNTGENYDCYISQLEQFIKLYIKPTITRTNQLIQVSQTPIDITRDTAQSDMLDLVNNRDIARRNNQPNQLNQLNQPNQSNQTSQLNQTSQTTVQNAKTTKVIGQLNAFLQTGHVNERQDNVQPDQRDDVQRQNNVQSNRQDNVQQQDNSDLTELIEFDDQEQTYLELIQDMNVRRAAGESSTPIPSSKIQFTTSLTGVDQVAEQTKPTEQPKQSKPTEQPKQSNQTKPTEQPKQTDQPKPTNQSTKIEDEIRALFEHDIIDVKSKTTTVSSKKEHDRMYRVDSNNAVEGSMTVDEMERRAPTITALLRLSHSQREELYYKLYIQAKKRVDSMASGLSEEKKDEMINKEADRLLQYYINTH